MTDSATEDARVFPKFSDAVLLAAAPLFGYVFAYLYRRGQADRFRIPSDVIRLDLTDVLVSTLALVSAMALLVGVAHAVDSLFTPSSSEPRADWVPALSRALLPAAFVAALAIPFEYLYRVPIKIFFVITALIFVLLILPDVVYFARSKGDNFAARLDAARGAAVNAQPPAGLFRRVSGSWIRLVFAIFYLAALYYCLGDSSALYRQRYWVTDGQHPKAMLVSYGSTRVLAPFKDGVLGATRELTEDPLTLHRENVGPLRVPDKG